MINPSLLPKRSELDPAGPHLYMELGKVLDLAEFGEKSGLQTPLKKAG